MLTIYSQTNRESPNKNWSVRYEFSNHGAVWFVLEYLGNNKMSVAVYDEDFLRAMRDDASLVTADNSPQEASARNKFGTGRMLRASREVIKCFPTITDWIFSRVTGASDLDERAIRRGTTN